MVKTGEKGKAAAAAKNPSPDTVTCIDLTGSDVYDSYRPRKERRLGSVRKELAPPSAKKRGRGGLKTTGLDAPDTQEIIVIDSDSDEDVPMAYNDDDCAVVDDANTAVAAASRPTVAAASRPAKKAKSKKSRHSPPKPVKKSSSFDIRSVILSLDNDDDCAVAAASRPTVASASRPAKKAKSKKSGHSPLKPVKKEGKDKIHDKVDDKVDSEGVEIVEATAPVLAAATMVSEQAKNTTTNDDDIVVEGVLNETRLPHMRQHCTRCPFNSLLSRRQANSNSCDLCYCYVCDCPVKDCKNWYSATSASPEHNHCCASEKVRSWEKMRSRAKNQSSNSTPDVSSDDEMPPYHLMFGRYDSDDETRPTRTYGMPGPFKPDHPYASHDHELTRCRHCSWFSRLCTYRRGASSSDWCKVCGRVASERDLEKDQVAPDIDTPSNPLADSYCIGEKDISFRIKAHDPRLFDLYKANWEEHGSDNPGWHYDQADRDEEVFLHRIGRAPMFGRLLGMVPRFGNENVPDEVEIHPTRVLDAADAIIIEDPKELEFVVRVSSIFDEVGDGGPMKVAASWDKTSRTGNLKFRFVLPKNSFVGHAFTSNWARISRERITAALGLWCGLFPLQPSELCIRFNGSSSEDIINRVNKLNSDIHMGNYVVERDHAVDVLREKLPSRVDSLLSAKDAYESRLTMTPSDGSRFGGGSCIRDTSNSFANSVVRFFSERFPSMMKSYMVDDDVIASYLGSNRRGAYSCIDAVLGYEIAATAQACFKQDINSEYKSLRNPSIKDIMIQLENLGHESEDCVEGLKIELLEFQRQSLKWALECEQTPGGVQSFSWSKIPTPDGQGELYYNPILKGFRRDKPALVRGGFIAEQMGLGKTIISLALILKNPAPEFPLSGSSVTELNKKDPNTNTSENCGWEKNLYEKTSTSNKKTGSIICRGTLVICPVSLVGQWIDEAKSKLEDPGLVYSYHGPNRKRDPKILSANSIVVTTYDILASDAFRRSKNRTGTDYCPPLQQIRWWRIICDEGHLLRERGTRRSMAVQSLVADNKWIVTGTPMNTAVVDLKNQLRFLGFEHIERLFNGLYNSYGTGNSRQRILETSCLLYLLRPIMMRHSQQQKYRGTSTTLMSLPAKTEREEKIIFTESEKKEYSKIEEQAQRWYLNFRVHHQKKMSTHFLKISSKLTPLRIACSGGRYPLDSGKPDEDGLDRPRNVVRKYSNFVFESKFKILLAKLEKIRDTEPDSKSLVFSQFSSTLDWLKIELPKHGFQFRTLTGDMAMKKRAKALADFQNDPPTTIFLLSMRSGAVGINLTQANRVFLMEPSFNPALEAQAIGRVHRLGQKRPVEIVKLIVKDSFEERMVKFLKNKYGSDSEKKPEDASENGDTTGASGKKDPKDQKVNSQAGNLKTDKVKLVTEEFDTLFGVEDRLKEDEPDSAGEGDDMKPDAALSLGNI